MALRTGGRDRDCLGAPQRGWGWLCGSPQQAQMCPHPRRPPAPPHRPRPALLEFTQGLRASPGQVPPRPQESWLDLRILFLQMGPCKLRAGDWAVRVGGLCTWDTKEGASGGHSDAMGPTPNRPCTRHTNADSIPGDNYPAVTHSEARHFSSFTQAGLASERLTAHLRSHSYSVKGRD